MPEDIVLVSNRGPVSWVETGGRFETKPGAGGLAGALDSVARRLGDHAVWIAAAGDEDDRKALAAGEVEKAIGELGYKLHLIDVDPETYDRYYNVVSNRMLWFANHCLWDELAIDGFGKEELAAWHNAYESVNERFADTVAELAPDDALVLFQDYHLVTAPAHLRARDDEHIIGHFTHTSFCGPAGLDRLPAPIPRSIIDGMLCADLIGFHVAPWVEGFYASCRAIGAEVDEERGIVTRGGRRTWVRAYPIPVDVKDLRAQAAGSEARRWAAHFGGWPGPLLVRADRAEPSKNIIRGFEAFRRVLERGHRHAESLRFVACLYPSRESMPEYQEQLDEIDNVVAEINKEFPDAIDLFMEDDYDRTLGALKVYDVLLVNSIMDGMNLVAKEGPAVNERSGALVLSRTTGAFSEIGDYAIEISDPFDVEGTADAIERALDMQPSDREGRADRLRSVIESTRPEDWIDAQLNDLQLIAGGEAPATPPARHQGS
jgi:trehalose 6-phosphate synthase